MAPDPLPAYLRLALTLEPVPAGATPDPFPAPAVRGMLGKALVDRYCPFGEPRCDPKGSKQPKSPHTAPGNPDRLKRPTSAHRPERAERAEGSAGARSAAGKEPPERVKRPSSDSAGAGGAGPQRPPTPAELCHLAEACPYGLLYAASRTRRPPYALYVPPEDRGGADGRGHDSPGAATVELTLYGPAWRTYAWALHALADALADRADRAGTGGGGGRSTRTGRVEAAGHASGPPTPGGWRIAAVARLRPDRTREELCGPDLRDLPADLAPDLLGLHPEPFLAPAPVTVHLLSPTHLLLKGRPIPRDRPVPFELLVKSTLDRFAGLYGAGASPVLSKEIRPVVEARAAEVPLLNQDVRPAEGFHHSKRSRARLDLGGTVGHLTYGPPAAAFFHLLQAAEVLHLGKNPTFGCGRIRVELEAAGA